MALNPHLSTARHGARYKSQVINHVLHIVDDRWLTILVGMWQLQGHGRGPHYTNVQYPFFVDPPHPPYTDNECGSYLTHFRVPEHLKGHQLRLRFEGVDSGFHVWINGKEVGYST